jgi:methionyl-tRNA formyltransferase
MKTLYFLTNCYSKIESLVHPLIGDKINIRVIKDNEDLNDCSKDISGDDILFSFSHNILVPPDILDKVQTAINVHPGPPDFPGRDAQHFALYQGITKFGATLHKMTEKVDSGDILDIELFSFNETISPTELAHLANLAAYKLIYRNLPKIIGGEILSPLPIKWGKTKTSRKMFNEMCVLDSNMSKEEMEKRIRIFHVTGYQNIRININGHWFLYSGDSL